MNRDRFLDELAVRAGKSLPCDLARALLAEAIDHLDADIAARIELESPPEVAEVEAVAAFGPVGRLVRREVAVRQGRWHTPVLTALTVLGATWLPLILSGTKFGTAAFSFASLAFVALVVPFMMSCATRRPGRSLLTSIAAFWLLTTALLVATCGPYYGGPMGRSSLAGIADFYAGHAEARVRREAKYDRIGWPSPELRTRTRQDRVSFTTMSEVARRASQTVDLKGSARVAAVAAIAFALYLALLYGIGAWCERLMARGSRWTRWDFWRPE